MECKNRHRIKNILFNEFEKTQIIDSTKLTKIKSKIIICPQCNENIKINIKDYKINLFECKNKHKINKIFFNEFENTQLIDLTKIKCYVK